MSDSPIISQLRRNSPFGPWRLFAPGRSLRPHKTSIEQTREDPIETCPFEPGKQRELGISLEYYKPDGEWCLRVTPNRFPFLHHEGNVTKEDGKPALHHNGPWQWVDATGVHELIIESDRHAVQFHEFSVYEVSEILRAIRERYLDLKHDPRLSYFYIFRNTGKTGGASVMHPHMQLTASVVIPDSVQDLFDEYASYAALMYGSCLYCDHIEQITPHKDYLPLPSLLVNKNESCICYVPFAPEYPYEMWIMPTPNYCNPCFAYSLNEESFREDIARMMLDATGRLAHFASNKREFINYNLALFTAPFPRDQEKNVWHWQIRIYPRGFTTDGGFEIGTKLRILPGLPETYAQALRDTRRDNGLF